MDIGQIPMIFKKFTCRLIVKGEFTCRLIVKGEFTCRLIVKGEFFCRLIVKEEDRITMRENFTFKDNVSLEA